MHGGGPLAAGDCAHAKAPLSVGGTLVVYSYFEADPTSDRDNLQFFLDVGVRPFAQHQDRLFVLVVNSELVTVVVPDQPNFVVVVRPNIGFDFCAWRAILAGFDELRASWQAFTHFIVINDSVRGPFLPAGVTDWVHYFVAQVGTAHKLVGTTVNCWTQVGTSLSGNEPKWERS